MENLDKIILKYIPIHKTCRFKEQARKMQREKEKSEIMGKVADNITINIRSEWIKEDPDMNVCRACRDTIYSNQFRLQIYINNEPITQNRPVTLCTNCYHDK